MTTALRLRSANGPMAMRRSYCECTRLGVVGFAAAVLVLGLFMTAAVDGAAAAFPGQNGLILFGSNRLGSASGLWTMRSDGSMPQPVGHIRAGDAAYSADGKRVVFTSPHKGHDSVYVMNADGSHPRRLTNPKGSNADHGPAFSPNGRLIVFE